ncbi:hypothetical protein BDN70DRAFT_803046, partial [Pholiota conissans]
VMDATCIKDNKPKMLKILRRAANSDEKRIAFYLCSPELMREPGNHCVPIDEVLAIPEDADYEILVMPFLVPFDFPRFDTLGEIVDFFKEVFVGLQFLHRHRIVHWDCTGRNLMMDASELVPEGVHPIEHKLNLQANGPSKCRYMQMQRPPRYLWINFGMSVQFSESDTSFILSADPGNDGTLPEYQALPNLYDYRILHLVQHDPFASDICYPGNMIRRYFLNVGYSNFEFLLPLVADMTANDPSKRPPIDKCISRLDELIGTLSSSKLHSVVSSSMSNERLNDIEEWWQSQYKWLESCGYRLRQRYKPGWVASWVQNPSLSHWKCEDRFSVLSSVVIDATSIKDNKPKMLKKILRHAIDSDEKRIALYLCSPELASDPENHCVPIDEVLSIPGDDVYEILVMPRLAQFDFPRFDTLGEIMDFFREVFVGLQFLHRHRIAHRDCTGRNLMMDANGLIPQGFHPMRPTYNLQANGPYKQRYMRTQRPPKYFWIDFGMSVQFSDSDTSFILSADLGNDRTLPEYQCLPSLHDYRVLHLVQHDPFPSDIYYLGNMVRRYFFDGKYTASIKKNLDILHTLVADMTATDPSTRPTIDECLVRLDEVIKKLSSSKLRSQVHHAKDNIFGDIARFFPYWTRRVSYVVRRIPPIPVRKYGDSAKSEKGPL